MSPQCPLCNLRDTRLIWQSDLCVAVHDGYPVSDGHTLVIPRRHEDSHLDMGVFVAAYVHMDDEHVDSDQRAWLRRVLLWFQANLHAPVISDPRALFWFRGQRNPCLDRVWELRAALREVGEKPSMIKTSRPGVVVYEDTHQVAAVPFRSAVSQDLSIGGRPGKNVGVPRYPEYSDLPEHLRAMLVAVTSDDDAAERFARTIRPTLSIRNRPSGEPSRRRTASAAS